MTAEPGRTSRYELTVGLAPVEAFAFFSDVSRLNEVTPPWFRLDPLVRWPVELEVGSRIAYRFRWRRLRLSWRSRITDWRPPRTFAYEQERGPYRFFRHEHIFEPVRAGTRVVDVVTFGTAGGGLIDRWLVEPELARVFAFRRAYSERRFPIARQAPSATAEPLTTTGRPPTLEAHAID